MSQPTPTPHQTAHRAHHAGHWRRRAGPGLLVLALACPGLAHPISLGQLLTLPLETLLQLNISQRRSSADSGAGSLRRPAAPRGPT